MVLYFRGLNRYFLNRKTRRLLEQQMHNVGEMICCGEWKLWYGTCIGTGHRLLIYWVESMCSTGSDMVYRELLQWAWVLSSWVLEQLSPTFSYLSGCMKSPKIADYKPIVSELKGKVIYFLLLSKWWHFHDVKAKQQQNICVPVEPVKHHKGAQVQGQWWWQWPFLDAHIMEPALAVQLMGRVWVNRSIKWRLAQLLRSKSAS